MKRHHRIMLLLTVTALVVGLVLDAFVTAAPARSAGSGDGSWTWPLQPRPEVVEAFDPPEDPYGAGHRGIDLAGRVGQPVLAVADGRVSFVGMIAGRGVVAIDHDGERSTYEPVTAAVRVGDQVHAGQPIGRLELVGGHCWPAVCLHLGRVAGEVYLDPLARLGGGAGPIRLLPFHGGSRSIGPGDSGGWLSWPVADTYVTSPYGMRFHPILHYWKLHDGTDFGAGCGTPVYAAASGTVISEYYDSAYGNRITLNHGNVNGVSLSTSYNHLTSFVAGYGQHVARGELIGYAGTTGWSTGCHLHFMVYENGATVDPMTWL
jgi:murein DD-endopeptidase MepM/ murein hydrolase activator NlpD